MITNMRALAESSNQALLCCAVNNDTFYIFVNDHNAVHEYVIAKQRLMNDKYGCMINLNIVKISMWPCATSKSQELQFFCVTKLQYNEILCCCRDALAYKSCPPVVRKHVFFLEETPTMSHHLHRFQ